VLRQNIQEYLRFAQTQRGLALLTIKNYTHELHSLEVGLGEGVAIGQISSLDIKRLIAQTHSQGLAPRSLARKLSAWRSFFDWAGREKLISHNPCKGIKPPKSGQRLPKALAPDQAMALMERGNLEQSIWASRDRAILELLYSSGLRLSELVSLDWRFEKHTQPEAYSSASWLTLSEAQAEVLGKGAKRRSVPIGSKAMQALHEWRHDANVQLERLRKTYSNVDSNAVFIGPKGQRISPRLVQTIVKTAGARAGIPASVHPHVLRHSFASHILQSSSDLRAVQELLGHANISTTQIYTSLDFQRLTAVYDNAHPRAKSKSTS
jgi:integrase/recombinase XerC